jgi:cyclic pyranopterin phosphate synthase
MARKKKASKKQTSRKLTHLDGRGAARMVDVSKKRVTARRAVASGEVRVAPETLRLILDGDIPKGDVFAAARIAGIQAAKRTADLIPLCHPLPIEAIDVAIASRRPDRILITATAIVRARTGIEMEALTAVSVAALTIYDMCKAVDRGMVIGPVRLEEKSGGRSGTWRRAD